MGQEAALGSEEQYGVQMLRAAAASAVVFHHSLEESNGAATAFSPDWLTTSGAAGVDIFFVISGFIMLYTSFRPRRPSLAPGTFLVRRATRIYPFYWACCLGMLGLTVVGFMRHHRLDPGEIALSLSLLPSPNLILTVSWTLVYEVYFYLIFAMTLVFRSAVVSALGTTAIIALLCWVGRGLEAGTLRAFLINPIPIEFAAGLWIAIVLLRASSARRRRVLSPAWALLGAGLLVLAPLYVPHATTAGLSDWPRVLAWGLPATLIVAASLSAAPPRNALESLLVFLGDASYAIYLTHVFVMIGYGLMLKTEWVSQAPQVAIVPLIVLVAILTGIVAHLTVEKPLFRMVRRWTGREPLLSKP